MLIKEALDKIARELSEAEIFADAGFEARLILEAAGVEKTVLYTEPQSELSAETEARAFKMSERRISGEPLQYILGEWEFYGLPFRVGRGVLIPRQDTETAVEVCAEFLKTRDKASRAVLDLCAGSGCIGITLAKLFGARATLVEKSPEAFEYLKANIALNGVSEQCAALPGDVLDENTVSGAFDVIVSNPPYLTENDMKRLQREVTFEPEAALFGGADGLDFYRKMLRIYPAKLNAGGLLCFEVGAGQAEAVCGAFRENGLEPQTAKDLSGIGRVVYSSDRRTAVSN